MKLSTLDIAIFAAYIVGVMAVGLWTGRSGARTKRDYFLAGDKLPWWMVGGSIVASNISSHHFIGFMGMAYTVGFAAMTIEWGAILLGFNALLWIFLPFYLRNGFYTMPEFLERRFSRTARSAFGVLILLTYIFVEISAVLLFGAIAIHSLLPEIGLRASILTLAAFTGVYTILGGLRAVVWTEMLQLIVLMAGGISVAVATFLKFGGWSAVTESSAGWQLLLPATNPDLPWTMFLGGLTSISIFYCAANQFIVQRALAAKDEWHARMGVNFQNYLKMLLPFIILVPGIMARKLFPDLEKGDFVFPTLVKTLLPTGVVGLVMAGLIAAIMSHVSGALNSCATIATIDFYIPHRKREVPEREAVFVGRSAAAIILLASIVWAEVLQAHNDKPIFGYLLNAYGYFAPGIAAMFLLGVFWKRATNAGALAAGILTIPLSLLLEWVAGKLTALDGIVSDLWKDALIPGRSVGSIDVFDLLQWTLRRFLGLKGGGLDGWEAVFVPGLNRAGVVFWACLGLGVLVSLVTKPRPVGEIQHLIWTPACLRVPEGLKDKFRGLRSPALWWAMVTAIILYMYWHFGIQRL